jgi:hypothetical protein
MDEIRTDELIARSAALIADSVQLCEETRRLIYRIQVSNWTAGGFVPVD